jgi:hypothetical protein
MALSPSQLVRVSEITQELLATITALAPSRTDEQNTEVVADIVTWNLKRNSRSVELKGEVDYKTQRLLDDIRLRVRNAFDLPLYSEQTHPTSGAVANTFIF